MIRLRCTVEYDGTDFAGFQVQPGQPHVRTVQGVLEAAVAAANGQPTRVVAAGRTDAGVHAVGQVVHFDSEREWDAAVWQRALNARLPRDVVIHEVRLAPPAFHARYAARSRAYKYTVYNRPVRAPLMARWAWHVAAPLDVTRMNAAAEWCHGQHDFSAFAARAAATGTVRRILALTCRRYGDMVVIDVLGDAFLRHMVRRLVGSLVRVGRGELTPEALREILASRRRDLAGPAAPAAGLCLVKVNY